MSSEPGARLPLRSLLFVPGNRPDWLTKAEAAGADAAILDLEDAVPPAQKPLARAAVAAAIADYPGEMALFVRINPLRGWAAAEELRTVVHPRLAGIVVPKVDAEDDVRLAAELLRWCEREQGLPAGRMTLIPLLETATALHGAHAIAAASPRVDYLGALTGSGGDVERAIGYRWTPAGAETLVLRARTLLDVRAAGVTNPVTGLWTRIGDLTGLRAFAEQNRGLGYTGMMVVHPSHVRVVNEVFTPTAAEFDRYARLVAAVEQAQAASVGAIAFEGEMVDEAMAQTARRWLERRRRA